MNSGTSAVGERSSTEASAGTSGRWSVRRASILVGMVGVLAAGVAISVVQAVGPEQPAEAVPTSAALEIFDRPQTAEDRPSVSIPRHLAPDSFRLLMTSEIDGVTQTIYATKNDHGVCIVVPQAESIGAGCSSEADFAETGADLQWSPIPSEMPDRGVTWSPNGEVSAALLDNSPTTTPVTSAHSG